MTYGTVTWAEPGSGAVATQAAVEPAYGPRGLERMRAGRSAPEALAELVAADESGPARQVAMVDAHGGIAAHAGWECMAFAGQVVGHHHSCQANLMQSGKVWGAMSEAYLGASGSLAERLLDALDAGEAAGGPARRAAAHRAHRRRLWRRRWCRHDVSRARTSAPTAACGSR